jgi:hypothetical protein
VADQDLKWWHVRWRLAGRAISRFANVCGKVIGLLCLVAAIGYGVLYLLSPWLFSQRMSRIDPRLSIVPADLSTKAEAPLSNVTTDCYGFSFRLPNKEVARTITGDLITVIRFRDGGSLMVHNPSRNSGIFGIATIDTNAAKLIGPEMFPSKYKLVQAAMWATPKQAKWWKFRNVRNERVEYLLLTKFSFLTRSASSHAFTLGPIYAISAGSFHGFQVGDPNVLPYDTHVDLFDGADRYFAFDIIGPKEHGQVLTQAEINAIVTSIKPDSER